MVLSRVSLDDYLGTFWVRSGVAVKWDSYYRTIDALRPLFAREEFNEIISGFYINVADNYDAVRIKYFVGPEDVEKGVGLFRNYFEEKGIVEIKESKPPKPTAIASGYGGDDYEQDFRDFLSLQNIIGLELLKNDALYTKRLFATYRWQVRKAELSIEDHFKLGFSRLSPTFESLTEEEKAKFFELLGNWPTPNQVDWAHMMVNLILGCDWNGVFKDPKYITPGKPLDILAINHILRVSDINIQIPLDWTPKSSI